MADAGSAEQLEPTIIAVSQPFLRALENAPNPDDLRATAPLLWEACRKLALPMHSYTTALLYFQRFLILADSHSLEHPELATACLLTALKTEGSPKKLESVTDAMNVACTPSLYGLERQILETNAFDFRLVHAHPYTVKICKSLQVPQQLAVVVWSVATDAYETPAVVQYPAHTVALGCICVAARLRGEKLLIKDTRQLGSRADAVKGVMRILMKFYCGRTASNHPTHASLSLSEQDHSDWLSNEKPVPSTHYQNTIPAINGHRISMEGVARYRLNSPR